MLHPDTYDVCSGLDHFVIIGVNYHNADTSTRSSFAVSDAAYGRITEQAIQKGITDIFVLSTCNRTEVYGIAGAGALTDLLCEATGNTVQGFKQHGYVHHGINAVMHLFKVAAGLDSQILGDYEILMQLKKATKYAKEKGLLGTLLDRLVNFSLQASKRIKSETRLSTGTVSVAYAAIEVIREKVKDIEHKNILLVGAGKFGCNVAKNINEYFPGATVRITNRTHQKAVAFAQQYQLECVPYEQLGIIANESDVLIASTTAEDFTILPGFFPVQKPRLLLDLSVPKSIDPDVESLPGTTLMDVDEISAILHNTFAMRKAEVPKALAIIQETLGEFVEWHKIFLHRHFLGEVKSKLYELSETRACIMPDSNEKEVTDARIQKAVKTLAVDLRTHTAKGCQYISTINKYLQMDPS
ncbi:glutamyl-tRNA reductase [Agriterribacter sp.]|uniref:glutamyl-tRNA reductase n=1 Tax=Agriterribacter sp. TaxID=2821509 RepID=UPI002BFB02AD|nr:glutamyl-tRNA reductase [Agriterribacter sp.]HRO44451.1 glutamyl-tRNA reductase [Agriterribacter sp.]HRQ16522.1 glutamyl-tRNA reductase [Agriterribacter sp.]